MSEKIIDNTPITDYTVDWGDPDGDGAKEKSLASVQAFIKAKLQTGENILKVTFTQSGNTITSDKTAAEVKAAHDAGKHVFSVLSGAIYPLISADSASATFESVLPDEITVRKLVLNGSSVTKTDKVVSFSDVTGSPAENAALNTALNSKIGKVLCTYVVDVASQLSTKTHGVGLTCICKGDGKIYTSNGSAWDSGVLGGYGIIYIAEGEQYLYSENEFIVQTSNNAHTLNGHDENYFAKESEVVKKNGYYPSVGVGSADNLKGSDDVNAQYLRRTSGGELSIGSGAAHIKGLKGNSIVLNQIIPSLDTENGVLKNWIKHGGGNAGIQQETEKEITITNYIGVIPKAMYNNSIIIGNKYYFYTRAKSNNADNYVYCRPLRGGLIDKYNVANEYVWFRLFGIASENLTAGAIRYNQIVGTDTTTIDKTVGMCMIDVTKIENSTGLTFATKELFESWCAAQGINLDRYIPYNAGEVINCKISAIRTDGFNQYNPTTGKVNVIANHVYQITGAYASLSLNGNVIVPDASGCFTPATNGELMVTGGNSNSTCVHLKWSGKRDGEHEPHWEDTCNLNLSTITGHAGSSASEAIFPDGLVKVGDVADELIADGDGKARKAIKRFGKVDLGTLEWSIGGDSGVSGFYQRAIISSRVLTEHYAFVSGNNTYSTVNDKTIFSHVGSNYVSIRDDSYSDAASFKAAMSGVYLYYELTTPLEYTLDTPIDMTYRVDDFGTETAQVLSGGNLVDADIYKTAPLNYDVVYSLNVVDTVRNLNRNYLGLQGTNNTFAAIASALAAYGLTMSLGTYDSTNEYYPVTITGGWKPAASAPASASAAGTKGMYYIGTGYIYVCVDTDTWKRFALSNW